MNLKTGDFVKILKNGEFFKIVQIKNIYSFFHLLTIVLIKNA